MLKNLQQRMAKYGARKAEQDSGDAPPQSAAPPSRVPRAAAPGPNGGIGSVSPPGAARGVAAAEARMANMGLHDGSVQVHTPGATLAA
eukprot:6199833-Pleurochrysis_carterae.AAC.4